MKNATTKISGQSSVNKRSPGAPKPSPVIADAKPNHAKAPVTKANNPLGTNRHVTLDITPGSNQRTSTFSAPRKDPSTEPSASGYTKMAMYTGGNGKGNGSR